MSASPLPFLVPRNPAPQHRETAASTRSNVPLRPMVRRRPNMEQGKALEILGHAIEYLVDSRMHLVGEPYTGVERDAVQILSHSSRELFAMCPEVVPVTVRLRQWAADRLGVSGMAHASTRG